MRRSRRSRRGAPERSPSSGLRFPVTASEDFRSHRSGGLAAVEKEEFTLTLLQVCSVCVGAVVIEPSNPILRGEEKRRRCAARNTEANPVDLVKISGLVAQLAVGLLARPHPSCTDVDLRRKGEPFTSSTLLEVLCCREVKPPPLFLQI